MGSILECAPAALRQPGDQAPRTAGGPGLGTGAGGGGWPQQAGTGATPAPTDACLFNPQSPGPVSGQKKAPASETATNRGFLLHSPRVPGRIPIRPFQHSPVPTG
ncbi:hypothetical protein GCM10027079_17200 [Sediminivirga luteola]|uniref:Uncharacterized protein n=1 Tax=Sediminivirga luteola TaxID=1774748 RepID=A0A8J2TVQ3_9MICO|nr:hypothetical protein GCM10011333_04660 [Sediminivirga luteola]